MNLIGRLFRAKVVAGRIRSTKNPSPRVLSDNVANDEVSQLIFEGKQLCEAVWKDTSLYKNNYSKAIVLFEKALSIEAQNTAALTNLGAALSDTGKHQQALNTLQQAEKIGTIDRNLYFNIGVAMMNLNSFRNQAKPYFEKAQKLTASNQTLEAYFDPMGY